MEINIISDSPQNTKKIAEIISEIVDFGDVLILVGELGGGKTTFLSGFIKRFGLPENLTSPSFTIINIYELEGDRRFVHVDLYRLDGIEQVFNTQIDEYIEDTASITCIEWGDKIIGYVKMDYLLISLSYILKEGEETINKRLISIKSKSDYWDKKLNSIRDRLSK